MTHDQITTLHDIFNKIVDGGGYTVTINMRSGSMWTGAAQGRPSDNMIRLDWDDGKHPVFVDIAFIESVTLN